MIEVEQSSNEVGQSPREVVRAEFDRTMNDLRVTLKELEQIGAEINSLQRTVQEKMQQLKELNWQYPTIRAGLLETAAQEIEQLADRLKNLEQKRDEQKILSDKFSAISEELLRYLHSFDRGERPQA